ncbi:MAG: hypothetical protein LBQ84_02460 [Flavobacteriaceae bacterium]|jgi:hypothetical protein|nr:hypothetical protein [Flavobacteriaceae bacterium]
MKKETEPMIEKKESLQKRNKISPTIIAAIITALATIIAAIITAIIYYLPFSSTPPRPPGYNIGNEFHPAGYMGCFDKLDINPAYTIEPLSSPHCYKVKVDFSDSCSAGFSGVYWTNTVDNSGANWGQHSGTDLSNKGFSKVTFWAKGQKGGEVIEFGSGGINNTKDLKFKYKDSYAEKYPTEGRNVTLTNSWQLYSIRLGKEDLSSVIGGFFFIVNRQANSTGITFYLDDISFE